MVEMLVCEGEDVVKEEFVGKVQERQSKMTAACKRRFSVLAFLHALRSFHMFRKEMCLKHMWAGK